MYLLNRRRLIELIHRAGQLKHSNETRKSWILDENKFRQNPKNTPHLPLTTTPRRTLFLPSQTRNFRNLQVKHERLKTNTKTHLNWDFNLRTKLFPNGRVRLSGFCEHSRIDFVRNSGDESFPRTPEQKRVFFFVKLLEVKFDSESKSNLMNI